VSTQQKPKVLLVDDEPNVIEGLAKLLRREYDVRTFSAPRDALRALQEIHDLAVVVSDMRMPGMDGATLLNEIMMRRPDVARIMLTGEAGRDGAIRAVNEGQILRFLTKPCPIEDLRKAIEAGVIHHRLVHAERNVLQETLIGCIKSLMEVLAIANPMAFGRAERIRKAATRCAERHGSTDFWQLEAAAMLSQLGYAALPAMLMEKVYHARKLTAEEQAKVGAVPDMANKLLEHIPRLEPVIQILAALKWPDAQVAALGNGTVGLGTRILCLILEYDALIARGMTHDAASDQLRARTTRFDPKLLGQLDACILTVSSREQTQEIPLGRVSPGMVLQQELRMASGQLLVPQGFQVTKTFLDRIAHIAPDLLDAPVRASLPDAAPKPGKS
jgi:response regulator RpfG family c-di-GMP phosphodiesterase